jgi:hypothetical protein
MHTTRTWLNNAHDVGQEYSCETMVGLDWARQYVTIGHTSGKWCGPFMKGAHMMMRMIWKQNEALTSALVMAACAEAETRWHSPIDRESREELEDVICFTLVVCGSGL